MGLMAAILDRTALVDEFSATLTSYALRSKIYELCLNFFLSS